MQVLPVADAAKGIMSVSSQFSLSFSFTFSPALDGLFAPKNRAGDGFICVYSIASMGSFQELVGFRNQIWRAKESEQVPIVIAANKSDLEPEREVDPVTGEEFAKLSNAFYIETSAKTGLNINEMMIELVREIVRSRQREGYADLQDHPYHHEPYGADGGGGGRGFVEEPPQAYLPPTKGYMTNTTPAGPLNNEESEAEESKFCCCSIM